ncbi:uncharacterized protein Z520_08561 [Fonsecaea multimorphosa CBS 102226]|uniref:VOC domain-containing protein n=1 Tax=Fonsecaea multimorphosa CBS 102226 TaxID=1442371 RepID=A0A0D2KGR0_9EURO|nr:uncharacterized protein Z520_08561 [Fonsecaea multimorphosa CBS 102226]KIX95853.1 hypothetical protein Z520_08561 [Fonsecaea multimorphosa CBS 102226]OAL21588.1 hypothetical protein AYO22_07984 [Fonsecaea multimorphosa]
MSIHHMSFPVPYSKVDNEVAFLAAAFGHMGLKEFLRPVPGVVGMGELSPWLWITGVENRQPISDDTKILKNHVALEAKDRAQVDAFHAAALKAGGTDNGAPGVRAEYGPSYYAAFVLSPSGHNFECVIFPRPGASATN